MADCICINNSYTQKYAQRGWYVGTLGQLYVQIGTEMEAAKEDKYTQAQIFKDIEISPDNDTFRKEVLDTHRQKEKGADKQRKAQASRERHRQAEKGTDMQRSAQTSRERHRKAEKRTDKRNVQTNREKCRQTEKCTDKQRSVQASREVHRQAEKRTDKQRRAHTS
jgi:hypothetical protein